MEDLSTQVIKKPNHLKKKDLIAIIGTYDVPQTVTPIGVMYYEKSEIAVNETLGKVQVYVASGNNSGLDKFKEDYPNAEIRDSAALDNPDEWKVIAFSAQPMPSESTALDNYFQARGKELVSIKEAKIINKEKKQ